MDNVFSIFCTVSALSFMCAAAVLNFSGDEGWQFWAFLSLTNLIIATRNSA